MEKMETTDENSSNDLCYKSLLTNNNSIILQPGFLSLTRLKRCSSSSSQRLTKVYPATTFAIIPRNVPVPGTHFPIESRVLSLSMELNWVRVGFKLPPLPSFNTLNHFKHILISPGLLVFASLAT